MNSKPIYSLLAAAIVLGGATALADTSVRLTDTIKAGAGSINLLKDISAAQLAQQMTPGGKLFFGVDVNEDASGNESSKSIGVALESVRLTVTTTAGTYTFSNFSTDSTAVLSKQGTTGLNTYYTLFGQTGSNNITGSTTSFNISAFDDVLVLNNVSFTGDVLSAQMSVQLLNTGNSKAVNDTFFDYSGGFEDLALLGVADAFALESAKIGVADAPSTVTYSTTSTPTVTESEVAASTGGGSGTTSDGGTSTTSGGGGAPTGAPAAPGPGVLAVVVLAGVVLLRLMITNKNRPAGAV